MSWGPELLLGRIKYSVVERERGSLREQEKAGFVEVVPELSIAGF